jgi:hypothetical protein
MRRVVAALCPLGWSGVSVAGPIAPPGALIPAGGERNWTGVVRAALEQATVPDR